MELNSPPRTAKKKQKKQKKTIALQVFFCLNQKMFFRKILAFFFKSPETQNQPHPNALILKTNTELAEKNLELAKELRLKEAIIERKNSEMLKIKEKYPVVWLKGNVAQGVVQLPNLKMACEFYREENKLCVFAQWNDAAGKDPREFVPKWLEVDPNQKIECVMDRFDKTGILYKIPVRGWDDVITMDKSLTESHPSYSIDGKVIEKVRSFRCQAGINGTFRRTEIDGKIYCHVWFHEAELPNQRGCNVDTVNNYLPKGLMRFDLSRADKFKKDTFGSRPDRLFHYRIPVTESTETPLQFKNSKLITEGVKSESKETKVCEERKVRKEDGRDKTTE